ncbi:efflux RND transporter permease subunit [Francisella sp. 19X1-34]|uniref:efflux RND transporter permease subunit n=1 Tax=Francisella sp. 19X1-34 TaxID=3087177 RepID=UPI002E32837C|nr:efflux RND transporter permease subunit [Francisella sp. 19X1-34]MED7789489.1 efflux RND transporter permease subunit [Francisella sp. 19X1-34]
MKFIDIFICRPILSIAISLMIIVVGVGSYFTLQVRQYPFLNSANITVTTSYPGANPSTIQAFITRPIEASVGATRGVDYMTSQSALGKSTITVYVKLGKDPDTVLSEVVQNVNAVLNELPHDAYSPTIKLNPAATFPPFVLAFTSKSMTIPQISAYINAAIVPKLRAQGGLSEVNVWGNEPYAMRIFPNKNKMAEYGISPNNLNKAIASNSLISAGGEIQGPYLNYVLNPETSISTAQKYKDLIIKKYHNQVIRLKDIATVKLGPQNYDTYVQFQGKPAVLVGPVVSPDANILTVVDKLVKYVPNIRKTLPNGLKLTIAYNSTVYIKDSIEDVIYTLIESILIVAFVIFLFLGSIRAVIIPVISIPLCLIGSFFLMKMMGFSINLLTLLAMILSIGLVVDDAIVVLENIHRHIENGLDRFSATIKGAREVATPVILMCLTLIIVYAPIGMMSGLTGQLFTEFAYSLAGTVLISGIVAYTLSPMLCSKILKDNSSESKFAKFINDIFDKLAVIYKEFLIIILDIKPAFVVIAIIVLMSCFIMGRGIKSELAPTEDQNFVGVMATTPSAANINYLKTFSPLIAKAVHNSPGRQYSFVLDGVLGGANAIAGGLILKPSDQRSISQQEATKLLQSKLNSIPGVVAFSWQIPSLPGVAHGADISLVIQSTNDYQSINEVTNALIKKMTKSGLFSFVNSNLIFDDPITNLNIDREKAGSLGITMSDVAKTLQNSYAGGYINYFFLKGYSFEVIPQLRRNQMLTNEQLGSIYVESDKIDDMFNSEVPLSALVNFKTVGEPITLNTFQQLNSATISAMLNSGVSEGQAINYIKRLAGTSLPAGFSYSFSGGARQFIQNGNTMMIAFGFAVILIFLALSAQFESFRDSLVILVTVPMAISGALIPLYLGQFLNKDWASLNIYTQLGLVTLIGLITKQGIMVVEFANKLQIESGLNKYDAIIRASSQRLRPILMTVAAMIIGVLPLVIATGSGSVSRQCIGVVVSSGLLVGVIFSLFILPVVYMYISSDKSEAIKIKLEERKKIDDINNKKV